jgi:dGTPase
MCAIKSPEISARLAIDPEVVEAACLAHDLGHPPFGHVGEEQLNKLVEKSKDSNGFEGNAQSFRIITKLSVRFDAADGLDLTRATLAACLKYPWLRDKRNRKKKGKWSAYHLERDDFDFARADHKHDTPTPEAALMDWADDIAYSVHDLEDFHRCGAIPWREILEDPEPLIRRAVNAWFDHPTDAAGRLRDAHKALVQYLQLINPDLAKEKYEGTRNQRSVLRTLTSSLIGRYIAATDVRDTESGIEINEDAKVEVRLLKQITRDYIISNPALVAQQIGQKKIIQDLFKIIVDESDKTYPHFLPKRLRYLWKLSDGSKGRFAADCICSLSESEAIALHARLTGTSSGSVLDPIVR